MFGSRNTVYHIFNQMSVSVYVCVCIQVCVCVWLCESACGVWMCECVRIRVYVSVCMTMCESACVSMCVYECVCVCTTTPKPSAVYPRPTPDSTSPVLHFWNEEMSKPLPSNSEFKSEREVCGRDWEGGRLRDEEERRDANIPLVTSLSDMLAIFSKYGFTLVNTTDSQNSAHPNPPSPRFWLDARACPCHWWDRCHLS